MTCFLTNTHTDIRKTLYLDCWLWAYRAWCWKEGPVRFGVYVWHCVHVGLDFPFSQLAQLEMLKQKLALSILLSTYLTTWDYKPYHARSVQNFTECCFPGLEINVSSFILLTAFWFCLLVLTIRWLSAGVYTTCGCRAQPLSYRETRKPEWLCSMDSPGWVVAKYVENNVNIICLL